MLRVRDITIKYGPCAVLAGISFDLAAGQIIALLGPNGAGKSTLMRSLNGTMPTASGSIELDGRPVSAYSRREISRRIAVVAQENETKFPVTVLEFVLAGRFSRGTAFGWETEHDISAAERALAECDLNGFGRRMMNELSGGERQRVVLARALATEAKILLLDEPTANLDLSHQALMFRLVQERCRSAGNSAVIVTHDLNLAAEFADAAIMLHRGRVFASGTPEEVLTGDNIAEVFGVRTLIDNNPATGNVRITPVF
ncbi:MAG: ABC transporter ATP-binding protein [Pyrinomonadaceae bacterium]|nr:ABC transporter ATP-binding protein [Pyrinomonadaceae bacterium]